jgi:hypothetical protein
MAQKDRFGNDYVLVSCKDKKGTGFAKGYVEIGNALFKVEPSEATSGKVDSKGNPVLYWVKLTKVPKQAKGTRNKF